MNLEIDGRVALVLGGSGGLGSAIAGALAQEGVKVAVAGLRPASVEASVLRIRAAGGEAEAVAWDLSDLDAIDGNVRRIEERLGGIDILVNNTGGPPPTAAAGQDRAAWTRHFQSMVLSVIAVTDRVLPAMRERRWGRVITSASSGVIAPIANLGISNALRLSLVGWSKTLAREVARDGVTCNVVVPGRIATDRIRFLDEQKARREGRDIAAVAAESVAAIPVGRYGDPREYGDAVAFLASRRAAYITGSVIRVDGGLIASV